MILSKKVVVKNSKFWKSLNYISDLRYIEVDINDLTSGSHVKILARCDYCGKDKEIDYKSYNKNISASIYNKFSCSSKCGVNKARENNLVKWGVEFPNQLEQHKEKCRNTIREKYGVEHISQLDSVRKSKSDKMILKSDDVSKRITSYWDKIDDDKLKMINDKRKSTNLNRYGAEHVTQVDDFKEKIKKTNFEKWGGFTYQSDFLMNKAFQTNIERYGTTYSSSSDIVKDKVKRTNLERWGYEYPSMSPIVKDKIKRTNLERYGVENIMFLGNVVEELKVRFYNKWGVNSYFKTDEFKNSNIYNPVANELFRKGLIISRHKNYINYIGDGISEFNCDLNKCHTFLISSIDFHNRERLGISLCTVCNPIGDSKSIKEKELYEFIESNYKGEIIQSYRDEMEIDIYLPDLGIGFEFNGLYWHSDKFKEKNYHLKKTKFFEERGIRIIHIWEDDWVYKGDIIKSQILNQLNLTSNKILARKCKIRNVNRGEYRLFLENNHIQGFIKSEITIGLYYNDELVSLMIFDRFEGRKKMEDGGWNLSRFCTKLNTNVIGGASKLLNYFIKEFKPKRIISYADMDWSKGDLYYKLGFKMVNTLKPDYKYIINGSRINKQRFTKSKLEKIGLDITKTESELTKEMGINKIYNVGQLKFELFIN